MTARGSAFRSGEMRFGESTLRKRQVKKLIIASAVLAALSIPALADPGNGNGLGQGDGGGQWSQNEWCTWPARRCRPSRSSLSATAPTGSCVAIGASRTLPEASRTVSLHRDKSGALARRPQAADAAAGPARRPSTPTHGERASRNRATPICSMTGRGPPRSRASFGGVINLLLRMIGLASSPRAPDQGTRF